ncbi:MAG: Na/Pi cotransporter family protein [Oscillospiraceae bacterium]
MDVFSFFTLGGGLAFFLFGMYILSAQLEKLAGGKLEKTLRMMTSNKWKGIALGCVITIAIQSSSALTVMLVGFVNSGIMELGQTIGVIMGSNIGTTLTAWVLSLSGIDSDSMLLRLLKPSSFSPVLALIGAVMLLACKSTKKQNTGEALLGFAVLMYGMELMSDAVAPLASSERFTSILTLFNNPAFGILAGTLFTALIQSSAASVGILQALSLTGSITYGVAIPIIMGQNIGTCITAILSAISANRSGKRVAAIHVSFNVLGAIAVCALFYPLNALLQFSFLGRAIDPVEIAMVHSLFNISTTALLLPFSNQLVKLAYCMVPERPEADGGVFIDQRLMVTPSFAVAECHNTTVKMAKQTKDVILTAMALMGHYDKAGVEKVNAGEDETDKYEDVIGSYLIKLSAMELSERDNKLVAEMLHAIGDLERIGDHALNICHAAQEMHDKDLRFSSEAKAELRVLSAAIEEILNMTVEAFENSDARAAAKVEPLEQVIDTLCADIKENHVRRLQQGKCTIELGFILSDIITNYERVSDHCSNLAVYIIELASDANFNTHAYLSNIKTGKEPEFITDFEYYKSKYVLPSGTA